MRLLIHATLSNLEARRWLAAQDRQPLSARPGFALLENCLAATFDPGDPAATQAFLAAQDPASQSVLAALMMGRPPVDPLAIARQTLATLHRQRLEARREALTSRLRQSGLDPAEVQRLQSEIVDIMGQMGHVSGSH